MYLYNDGEVALKKVMSPVPWDSTSGEEEEYLVKTNVTPQDIPPTGIPATSTPLFSHQLDQLGKNLIKLKMN